MLKKKTSEEIKRHTYVGVWVSGLRSMFWWNSKEEINFVLKSDSANYCTIEPHDNI